MEEDIRVFDAVPTQLFDDDRRSLLSVRNVLARIFGDYAYLEVGSHLGGSLQPFLTDPSCRALYSIDPRPLRQPDERGHVFRYPRNSTEQMLEVLTPAYGDQLGKLRCFERHARDVRPDELDHRPRLCFIDGQHTDAAVEEDFVSCLHLAEPDCVVVFDDAHVVYRGLRRCLLRLESDGVDYRAYVLPAKLAVVEVGAARLYRESEITERLATAEAFLHATEELDRYRRLVVKLLRFPGASAVRWVRTAAMRWSATRRLP